MIIHTFLYDSSFLNTSSILDPVLKTGGVCVLSSQALSYFVTPQELVDERPSRATNLNTTMPGKARLIVDQEQFASFLTDTVNTWTSTERDNLFAIIDQLCFSYNVNATHDQIELALSVWPQYLASSYVYSNTKTSANVYGSSTISITCPDYVSFTFVTSNGTNYQLRVWLNNTIFFNNYPLSKIRVIVPPLPLSTLYTSSIVNSTDNIFTTIQSSATTNQQTLQSYIQSGQYSNYITYNVTFVDGNNDAVQVLFNILYNGTVPSAIAIRTAIRTFILGSGVGTLSGWQSIAPSLFVTELFYLLPLWDQITTLVNTTIYPNITPVQKAISNADTILYDQTAGFISANLDIITSFYNNQTVLAIPDPGNDPTRLSLAVEHPTYRDLPTNDINFITLVPKTQQFATLLGAALVVASGLTSTNTALSTYTPPNDNRSYVTFSVGDVQYYVMMKTSYLALINAS